MWLRWLDLESLISVQVIMLGQHFLPCFTLISVILILIASKQEPASSIMSVHIKLLMFTLFLPVYNSLPTSLYLCYLLIPFANR